MELNMSISNKIDFAIIFSVRNANPNGDPLNGNRPRTDYDGYGELSDVCLKRKIRNRLQDLGENIFVQSDDRCNDSCDSLKSRAEACKALADLNGKDQDLFTKTACKEWFDVRAFGQVFAYKSLGKASNVSVGIRGPVSVQSAVSVSPVQISELQITKSVNNEPTKDGKKSSDTMGTKYRVDFGVYTAFGSINTQLSEKTGFSDEDALKILEALKTLFINDSSSARPDGSMEILKLYWWKHNNPTGQYSSAKVHRCLKVKEREGVTNPRSIDDYIIHCDTLEGLALEVYDGI